MEVRGTKLMITIDEINARITEIERQRNEALAMCAEYAGRLCKAALHITDLERRIEEAAAPKRTKRDK